MGTSREEQGQIKGIVGQRERIEKEKTPGPWIQKYLDMADLMMRRGKLHDKRERNKQAAREHALDSVRAAK